MAAQTLKGDLELRMQMLEVRMDNFMRRFEEANLLILDLRGRIEKLEAWGKKMQEDGRFSYDPKIQENVGLDKTANPTQMFDGTTAEKDEVAVLCGRVFQDGSTRVTELENKIQQVSVAVDSLEQLLEMQSLFQSLRSQEGAPWQEQGTTQEAGMLEHGPVNEREEFEDENRKQEELRQLDRPDQSGELVQDLTANSENQEHFGQGTAELGEDSVELEAAKESGTALSERVKLVEGAEDRKRGDEEKGNDYELEAEECNQEGRLAEEREKQEEAVQGEAGNEGEVIEELVVRSNAENEDQEGRLAEAVDREEEAVQGEAGNEGEGIEELVARSNAESEDQEERYDFPQLTDTQVHIEEALLDTSERLDRRYSEVADSRNKTQDSEENEHTYELEQMVGSEIKVGEKEEHVSELEVTEVEKSFAGVARLSSKESEGQPFEHAKQKNMIEATVELITADIEEEINTTLSHRLRRIVDERITKLVASSVKETDQKVKALEGEATEQIRVICSFQYETQRLQTELIKAIKRNSHLKLVISEVYGILNIQSVKHQYFEKCCHELIERYRDATKKMDEGLKYADLENKYKQFKAKYSDGKEQTGYADMETMKKKENSLRTFEEVEEELASFAQSKRLLMDSVVRALGTSPVDEYLKVEKVGRTEELEECRKHLVERVQSDPETGLKLIDAILGEEDEKHDYFWKGTVKELKLSMRDAVEAGCPLLTDLLLCYGFSCNEVTREGNSPLHYAARNGDVEVGMTLLVAGACVNFQNASNETPLHVALKHGKTEFGLLLLKEDVHIELGDANGSTPLHLAALLGSTELVNQLIESVADVNSVDRDGDTPLYNAALQGNVLVGEKLVATGADPAVVNNEGSTPLHVAAWQGNITFCFFLLNQGVPVDPMNSHNVTPLHLAAMENEGDIVQLLITSGARVNCLDERTDSPLHYAAKFGNILMMKTLLRAGANVLAVNALRRTPLHIAAAKGHTEACSLLINAKSEVNAPDERDRTPLHMVAMYGGSISVAEVLVKKGANVTAVDRNGSTPSDLGYSFENPEFSVWLEEQISARDERREKSARRRKGGRWKK